MTSQRSPGTETQGQHIKTTRRALKWTQRELSQKAGVRFTRVSMVESGHEIDPSDLHKIVRALEAP